jgi:RNA polymerase sigma-70 factor (ECF subfamily)
LNNSPQTQELLNRAATEPGAVEQLLSQNREPVRRMIELRLDRAVAKRVDASDVVQEVMLEASRRMREYLKNPRMPFQLWLRHIARDHIIDAHRRHRQAKRRSVDREQPMRAVLSDQSSVNLIGDLINRELTPASAAIRREMQQRFHEAVNTLPDDDREIILMRHFEQLSNQEVSVALNVTEAAASMRYLRAIRRLRQLLVPDES